MANNLKKYEITINKIISDKEVHSDHAFMDQIFNHIWAMENDEKQSSLKLEL